MYAVESKGEKLMLWGDLMHVAAVQFDNPSVTIQFDSNNKLAEAARNDKFALLLKQKDDIARARMRDILTSERSLIKDISPAEMDSRIGIIFTLFSGISIRRLLEPDLTAEQVLLAMKPALRAMLLPFA